MTDNLMIIEELTEKKINNITSKVENIFKHLQADSELDSQSTPKVICVVLTRDSFLSDIFWAKITDRIEKHIKLAGFAMKINVVSSPDTEQIQPDEEVCGYIILGLVNVKIVEELSIKKYPVVLMDYKMILDGYSHVRINNRSGVLKLATKIKELNHKSVLMIFAEKGYAASFDERYETYIDYFTTNIPDVSIFNCTVNSESEILTKIKDILNILDQNPGISVIICHNDVVAIEVIKELENKSYKIPQDISVVGFDNIDDSAKSIPPLTTINVPLNDLSQLAVGLLLRKIKDIDSVNIIVTIEPTIIVRESLVDISGNQNTAAYNLSDNMKGMDIS